MTPLRRQIAATTPCDLLPADMPMTIWAGDGFHLRVRDGRVLLLLAHARRARPRRSTPGVDPAWVDAVERAWRTPGCRSSAAPRSTGPRCWAGLYEMSPDKHAILGAAPECPNLFLLNGSSGHGVMHAPALGQLLAEIISDGKASSMDATPLRYGRFAEGALVPSSGVL